MFSCLCFKYNAFHSIFPYKRGLHLEFLVGEHEKEGGRIFQEGTELGGNYEESMQSWKQRHLQWGLSRPKKASKNLCFFVI